jgi:hypothetical protein
MNVARTVERSHDGVGNAHRRIRVRGILDRRAGAPRASL